MVSPEKQSASVSVSRVGGRHENRLNPGGYRGKHEEREYERSAKESME